MLQDQLCSSDAAVIRKDRKRNKVTFKLHNELRIVFEIFNFVSPCPRNGSTGQQSLWENGDESRDLLHDHNIHCGFYRYHYCSHHPPWQRDKRWVWKATENRASQPCWRLLRSDQVICIEENQRSLNFDWNCWTYLLLDLSFQKHVSTKFGPSLHSAGKLSGLAPITFAVLCIRVYTIKKHTVAHTQTTLRLHRSCMWNK